MKRKYLNIIFLFIPLIILNIISILNMYNSRYINDIYNNIFIKQIIWFILGYLIIYIINKYKHNNIFYYSKYLYILSIILLFLVLFFGNNINGSRCWFNFFGLSFQPSELTKFSLSLYLSYLSINKHKNELIYIIKIFIITLIPSILVFLEPDTGSIISFIIIFIIILFNSKLSKNIYYILIILSILFLLLIIILYIYYQDLLINILGNSLFYRIDRIINFTKGNSYQLENALITIGYSPLFRFSLNNILLYIPEAPTDFIFSFSIGNFGIMSGMLILLNLFLIDIYLLLSIKNINNKYYILFVKTFIGILLFNQIYNIMMNIGLLPIMGIPLPFISYGGTNTIINYLYLAFIINTK